jgi:hypothetical protein
MVYDWENKEEVCYRMYIEEKKSLEEIMEHLKEESGFAPRYVVQVYIPLRTTFISLPNGLET